jgi:hypothetical protein
MNSQDLSNRLQESETRSQVAPDEVPNSSGLQKLDLSHAINDSSLSIHLLASMSVHCREAVGSIPVFDLDNVYASPDARRAIEQSYITALFVVEAFARNYRQKLFRKLTRGNEKGHTILDPDASTFTHLIASGGALVVRAETVEHEGQFARRLTIAFAKETVVGSAT